MNQQVQQPGDAAAHLPGPPASLPLGLDAVAPAVPQHPASAIGAPIPDFGALAPRPPFNVRVAGAYLSVAGDIDYQNAADIEVQVLTRLHEVGYCLDLTAVDFIDTMGLVVLVRAYQYATEHGAHLRITCSPSVYAVLAMSGFTDQLPALTVTSEGHV